MEDKISQVWRFPKKYAELFKNISDQDTWIIIKELFFWDWINLNWLNKAYYDIIKVDLDNLEKSALNWNKGGRPRTKKTPGYENKKPPVSENHNLKERESEIERENESKNERESKKKKIIINNNISKEIQQSWKEEIKEYWDKDINSILLIIKEKHWLVDWPVTEQRKYWKLLKDKILWIKWFNWDFYNFIKIIIERTDKYRIWKTTSPKNLYYNLAELITNIKNNTKKEIWITSI